jgi:hypothetical protein
VQFVYLLLAVERFAMMQESNSGRAFLYFFEKLEPLSCRTGKLMVQVTIQQRSGCAVLAGHTGQSSQLFPVATGRNAQFLATVAKGVLVRQVEAARISA